MNNCLCESCCDKDYCLNYQDYKNPDGIITEPITACGQYSKLHTVEDIYNKADVVAMLEEIDLQFDKICFYKNMGEWKTVPEIKAEYKAIIREKINELKGNQEGKNDET